MCGELATAAVTNEKGDIRALGCVADAVGDFAGSVTLSSQAIAGIQVGFANGTLDLTDDGGSAGTSVLLSIGLAVPAGVHPVVLRAQNGDDLAIDTVLVTVR